MKGRLSWLTAIALPLLAACSKENRVESIPVNKASLFEKMPAESKKIDFERTLFLRLTSPPCSLSPLFTRTSTEGCLTGLVYQSLFSTGPEMEFVVNRGVVDDFKILEEGKAYSITLKQGLTWHDGHPFTTEDIIFSMELQQDKKIAVQEIRSDADIILETTARSDVKWLIEFKKVSTFNKWELLFPILPKHIWSKIRKTCPDLRKSMAAGKAERSMVGNGPYRLASYDGSLEVVLEKWPGWKGKTAPFKRIVWQILPDRGSALASFKAGRLDLLRMPNPMDFNALLCDPGLKDSALAARGDTWTYMFIAWNMKRKGSPFKDSRVRSAMAYTFNRKLFSERLFKGLQTPCNGPFHPKSWAASPDGMVLHYNPGKACSLLDQAGWTSDSKGWRKKDGKPLSFSLILPAGSTATGNMARFWKDDLKRLGMAMKIVRLEAGAFQDRLFSHDFDGAVWAWSPGIDPYTTEDIFGSKGWPNDLNLGGYSNMKVDELYKQGLAEKNPNKRKEIYSAIDRIIKKDQPYLFLWYLPELLIVRRELGGIIFGSRGVMDHSPGIQGWWFRRGRDR